MENATKALIIAAAVLIAIVLISLGVSILSSSNDSSEQVAQTSNAVSEATDKSVERVNNIVGSLSN